MSHESTRSHYRVAVWGTGRLGSALITEIDRLDSLELVGVLAMHSPEKEGRDIGAVLGIGPVGVSVTKEPATLIEARPDLVMYVPKDPLDWKQTDEHILMLLEAGINVITALAYNQLPYREDGALDLFQRAARAGGATLYTTGVNPDVLADRLVVTLSGLCNDVQHVTMKEILPAQSFGPFLFGILGFGKPLAEATMGGEIARIGVERYFGASVRNAARQLGVVLDSIEATYVDIPAPVDIALSDGPPILAGTLGTRILRVEGSADGKVFYTAEGIYYCGDAMRPAEAVADECWIIEIEGRPSLRTAIVSCASTRDDSRRNDGVDPSTPAWYATAAPIIQAVPMVVAADPGVLENPAIPLHYRRPEVKVTSG